MDKLNRLERLQRLHEAGALTDAEFETEKESILAGAQHVLSGRMWLWIAAFAVIIVVAVATVAAFQLLGTNIGSRINALAGWIK